MNLLELSAQVNQVFDNHVQARSILDASRQWLLDFSEARADETGMALRYAWPDLLGRASVLIEELARG